MSHITLFVYYKKNKPIHVYMLYTGYEHTYIYCITLPVITKISLDQSLTILVVKQNIQVSTKWFPVSKIWNIIINNYISTKDTGFNLPSIHYKISFKIHSIQHNIKNNSILNYALSTKISFHLSLTGLEIRNSSLPRHYHCVKTPYKIQTHFSHWFSPHENYKLLKERTPISTARLKFWNKLLP